MNNLDVFFSPRVFSNNGVFHLAGQSGGPSEVPYCKYRSWYEMAAMAGKIR